MDSNIPMYLVGSAQAEKVQARDLLEQCLTNEERLVTDAEVLQEILHRYVAIGRRDAIQPAFDALLRIVDEVLAVELKDVERAKTIVLGTSRLSARDAVHLATMERAGVNTILSFDARFDGFPGVSRLA